MCSPNVFVGQHLLTFLLDIRVIRKQVSPDEFCQSSARGRRIVVFSFFKKHIFFSFLSLAITALSFLAPHLFLPFFLTLYSPLTFLTLKIPTCHHYHLSLTQPIPVFGVPWAPPLLLHLTLPRRPPSPSSSKKTDWNVALNWLLPD